MNKRATTKQMSLDIKECIKQAKQLNIPLDEIKIEYVLHTHNPEHKILTYNDCLQGSIYNPSKKEFLCSINQNRNLKTNLDLQRFQVILDGLPINNQTASYLELIDCDYIYEYHECNIDKKRKIMKVEYKQRNNNPKY